MLLACGFTFMQRLGIYAVAHESKFYVVLQEANEHIFYMVSSYRKGASDGHNLHVLLREREH